MFVWIYNQNKIIILLKLDIESYLSDLKEEQEILVPFLPQVELYFLDHVS